jgi:hypothetical protein
MSLAHEHRLPRSVESRWIPDILRFHLDESDEVQHGTEEKAGYQFTVI